MKKLIGLIILYTIRFALSFRYKVNIKGLEKISRLKPGGVLFLPNHPTVFVDPTLVSIAIWRQFPVRPMVVEYMYYTPIMNTVLKMMNAIPVPDFVNTSNSLKKKKADDVIQLVIDDLKKGDNFLIYPAGKTKLQAKEQISASGVHKIIQATPEANIILVKTTGLWGSQFSRALNGNTPNIFKTIFWGIKVVLSNLLFFTPKREVTIEFCPAPEDFPYKSSRAELNRYLEKWYNRPDGIKPQTEKEPGESLNLVSYSRWKEELPSITPSKKIVEEIDCQRVPAEVKEKVLTFLSKISNLPAEQILIDMDLATDLGLDSLDTAEITLFLDDEFEVKNVPVSEMTSVKKVLGLASKQVKFKQVEEKNPTDFKNWFEERNNHLAEIQPGETMIESFLNQCDRMGKAAALADASSGVLSYKDAKLRILLLADYIRTLPGKYIGIMLPSSAAAYLSVLACQLAGKTPVMVNWTVGPKHLESVIEATNLEVILSSWAFLDRLENVDLEGIQDKIILLEEARRSFGIGKKLKALYHSKFSNKNILKAYGSDKKTKDDPAVILFTSGTENAPKGVPLSHENILSNQKAALKTIKLLNDDVLLGILPPFHSFGFTISGLFPLLGGIRAAYFPDPTDGKGVANALATWKATLTCGAPSFLKSAFKNASSEKLNHLRFCFTGAEKAPEDLFHLINKLDHCVLYEGYGITECAPVLTVNLTGKGEKGVGNPLPGVDLMVVSLDDYEPLEQGKDGLILAKGPNVFKGYLNPGLTSPFIEIEGANWYNTGDLGHLDQSGALILSGRLKRFIKIGGEMISLAAIETALKNFIIQSNPEKNSPSLAICAKEEPGEKTKIFLFTTESMTLEEVNQQLKKSGFSNLVKIYKIHELEEIPLMGSGKVNYRLIETTYPLV